MFAHESLLIVIVGVLIAHLISFVVLVIYKLWSPDKDIDSISNRAFGIYTLILKHYNLYTKFFGKDNIFLVFDYILVAQVIALFKSLSYKITTDNPCPTGEVNRVVKGVTIYPYTAK